MRPATENPNYRRQRLAAIRAAASVFAAKGFHGASTRDIAERLGIKQGSLYYYFSSKEEALGEVCLYGIEEYCERMERLTSHLTSYRERNEALKVYNDERLYLPESRRTELKRRGSRYRQLLEGMFEEGIRQGVIRESLDCHFAALAVIGICNAWGDIIVRDPELDIFDVIQKCTDLLLHGFSERRKVDRNGETALRRAANDH